jgi:hypothetical protein
MEADLQHRRLVAPPNGAECSSTSPGIGEVIAVRLTSRDGIAPPPGRIRDIIPAYHTAFGLLDGAAPIMTVDTTSASPATRPAPGAPWREHH